MESKTNRVVIVISDSELALLNDLARTNRNPISKVAEMAFSVGLRTIILRLLDGLAQSGRPRPKASQPNPNRTPTVATNLGDKLRGCNAGQTQTMG